MVPHRQALRAIALLSFANINKGYAPYACDSLRTFFPNNNYLVFTKTEIVPYLSDDIKEVFDAVVNKQMDFSRNYGPFYEAAEQLGVAKYMDLDPTPSFCLPPAIRKWRGQSDTRILVETYMLCKFPLELLADDLRGMWGFDVVEDDLRIFQELFVDLDYIDDKCWTTYSNCIGPEEAALKRTYMRSPRDYVRWRLGVPITLNSERVLDRLISEAYYTERMIKQVMGKPEAPLTKCELDRIKLERDTVFKGLDRRVKIHEVNKSDGKTTNTDAAREIAKIALEYVDHAFPTKAEVIQTEKPTLDQLK